MGKYIKNGKWKYGLERKQAGLHLSWERYWELCCRTVLAPKKSPYSSPYQSLSSNQYIDHINASDISKLNFTSFWPARSRNSSYLIFVHSINSGASVNFFDWGECYLTINAKRTPDSVPLYTVCYFTHNVSFYTECMILLTLCNFTHSVYLTHSM